MSWRRVCKADCQEVAQEAAQYSFGSRASCSPSPTTLKARTVTKMVSPGHQAIHGAWLRNPCATLSIEPQLGVGGCTPRPRKDSVDSAMMAPAMLTVACTRSGAKLFGKI